MCRRSGANVACTCTLWSICVRQCLAVTCMQKCMCKIIYTMYTSLRRPGLHTTSLRSQFYVILRRASQSWNVLDTPCLVSNVQHRTITCSRNMYLVHIHAYGFCSCAQVKWNPWEALVSADLTHYNYRLFLDCGFSGKGFWRSKTITRQLWERGWGGGKGGYTLGSSFPDHKSSVIACQLWGRGMGRMPPWPPSPQWESRMIACELCG